MFTLVLIDFHKVNLSCVLKANKSPGSCRIHFRPRQTFFARPYQMIGKKLPL